MTYKTLHRQLKIDQQEPHQLSGVISGAQEGLAVPAAHLTLAGNIISMIFYIKTVCSRQFKKCTKININIHIFFILINKYNNQHTKKEKDRCIVSNEVHVYVQINKVNYPPPLLCITGIFCVFDQLFVNVLLQSS
jgi:hypothetical protein